jgi:broad specificity phosphatase PhoE
MAVRVSPARPGHRLVRLIRHGRAAAGWNIDPDPDLDEVGRAQAAAVAGELLAVGSSRVVSSPLLRCRSTARCYADLSGRLVAIAPEVAEIPSPEGIEMADRVDWLRAAMQGTWTDLGKTYTRYRDAVVEYVRGCDSDTLIFSHFIAINAVIGTCLGDDRLVIRSLDNCSVTTVAIESGGLRLVEGGREADTLIR